MQSFQTCRFCKQIGADLKYGVRHWAHAKCGIEAQGILFISKVHNLHDFPILMLKGEVAKLEALRDSFRKRRYDDNYATICQDMIDQAVVDRVCELTSEMRR